MKNRVGLLVVLGTVVGLHDSAAAQIGGSVAQVSCDGERCGGSGGQLHTEFLYRVKPNGNSISNLEVGVEDGEITHYTIASTVAAWAISANIFAIPRTHDVPPTPHGTASATGRTCPFVLRFSGPAQTTNFQVGFDYYRDSGFHDVNWKTSNGQQAFWTLALGANNGPVHSPVDNGGLWEPPFTHDIGDMPQWAPQQALWDGELQSPGRHFLAGHMALIPVGPHRGKVLVWNWMRIPQMTIPPSLGVQHWSIVDVSGGTPSFLNRDLVVMTIDGSAPDPSAGDLFCSGHAWTRDGHLFVAGGDNYSAAPTSQIPGSSKLAYLFDPTIDPSIPGNDPWKRQPDLSNERWYPTVTALGTDSSNRDILIVAGGKQGSTNTYEAFDPAAPTGTDPWQLRPGISPPDHVFPGPTVAIPCTPNHPNKLLVYPRLFLLTSGKLFLAGFSGRPYRLDYTGKMNVPEHPVWEESVTLNPFSYEYTSAFLYPNLGGPSGGNQDIVVRLGGAVREHDPLDPCTVTAGPGETDKVEACSAAAADPTWDLWPPTPMLHARLFPNAVLLPDASIAVVSAERPGGSGTPTLDAEIFNDNPGAPNSWGRLAASAVRRGYHSTAVLLPDARVLVGGGEAREVDYEIFRPHYLTNGSQRPENVTPATLDMTYDQDYTLSYSALSAGVNVERAVLMAPGSITHHSDMHQRYVEMQTVSSTSTSITFRAPPSSTHAPRGYYMVFLVTGIQPDVHRRAPSNAVWAYLHNP